MRALRALPLSALLLVFVTTGAVAQTPSAVPDPQVQSVLDQLARLGPKPIETLTPAEARKQPTPADAVVALLKERDQDAKPEPVSGDENRSIDGPAGPIPIRIYWPEGPGPFPVVVYYHGGGWVIGDLDVYDASARALTNAADAIVVSSHYRLAPEHKFPAAHEDALAAYTWTIANARSLNGDPKRIAVAGESAGGNLAATVAIAARDRRMQVPVHQLLIYPVADYDFNTPSYVENATAKPLNRAMMQWFFSNYLNQPSEGSLDRISLVDVVELKGLPSATILTAGIDPLRSEGERYAERLRSAGIPVDHRNYPALTHEFFGMGAAVDEARRAVEVAGTNLKTAFENAKPIKLADPDRPDR